MTRKGKQVDAEVEAVKEELVEVVEAVEEAAPVIQEKPAKSEKKAAEPIEVIEGQLGIYESRVIHVPGNAKSAVVKNLGGGDLYVDNTGVQLTSNYRVSPGEEKEYSGAKVIFISSASRPNFRAEFYK